MHCKIKFDIDNNKKLELAIIAKYNSDIEDDVFVLFCSKVLGVFEYENI